MAKLAKRAKDSVARMAKRAKPKKRGDIPNIGYGKTIAAGTAGALTTIVAFAVEQSTGHPLPAEITAAVQTVITAAAVYFTHHTLFEKA